MRLDWAVAGGLAGAGLFLAAAAPWLGTGALFTPEQVVLVGAYFCLLAVLLLSTRRRARAAGLFVVLLLAGTYAQRLATLAWSPEALMPATAPVIGRVIDDALTYLFLATIAIVVGVHIGARLGAMPRTATAPSLLGRLGHPGMLRLFLLFSWALLAANVTVSAVFHVGIVGLGTAAPTGTGWVLRALNPLWALPGVVFAVLFDPKGLDRTNRALAIGFVIALVLYTMTLSSRGALLALVSGIVIALAVRGQVRVRRRTVVALALVLVLSVALYVPAATALRLYWREVYLIGIPSSVATGDAIDDFAGRYADPAKLLATNSEISGLADVLFGEFAVGRERLVGDISGEGALAQTANGFLPVKPFAPPRNPSEVIPEVVRGLDLRYALFQQEHPTLLGSAYIMLGTAAALPFLALWGAALAFVLQRPVGIVWKAGMLQFFGLLMFNEGVLADGVHRMVDLGVVYGAFVALVAVRAAVWRATAGATALATS